MSDDHPQSEHDPNDPVDAVLADWKESLQCSDAQLQSMLGNVLSRVPAAHAPISVRGRTLVAYVPLLVCGLAAALLIGLGLWNLPTSPDLPELSSNANESLHRVAFSSSDLHQGRLLACEFARVFEKPVLVLKHDTSCDIDDDPFVADALSVPASSSRVLLRYVVQEMSQSQTWLDIAREEVIGGREQQLQIVNFPALDINYWSHLLPDNSLWLELRVQPTQASDHFDDEYQLKANEPKVVWEHHAIDASRRLVMVFELLPSCDLGDVL